MADLDTLMKSAYLSAAKASKKPIKHIIFSLYRKQVGSKEYCYFFDLTVAKDYFQNNVDHTRLIGRWEKPLITRQRFYDPATLKTGNQEPTESQPSRREDLRQSMITSFPKYGIN